MMKEIRVIIPEEDFIMVKFIQEEFYGIMEINKSLLNFEPREVFSWNLSIMIYFNELDDNNMPTKAENEILLPFKKTIDTQIKGNDKNKPNSLFLAKITWNGTCELIYRVYNAEIVNAYLQDVLKNKQYPMRFDYRIK